MASIDRSEFLSSPDVSAFSDWLGDRFTAGSSWRHGYVIRGTGLSRSFISLHDAFGQYEWNGKGWPTNLEELLGYRVQLRAAVAGDDAAAAYLVCEAVLRWGGVWANNGRTLLDKRDSLLNELRHVSAVLQRDRTPEKGDLTPGAARCSMNAGFVKIYSVLLDSCVIYDGRVGAALGLLVRQYCEERNLPEVPQLLAFAYGLPKEAPNATLPKLRNPSYGPYRFPQLRPNPRFHTEQTMRANWLLQDALTRKPDVFSAGEAGFHELAAGLFMVGYDLTEANAVAQPA